MRKNLQVQVDVKEESRQCQAQQTEHGPASEQPAAIRMPACLFPYIAAGPLFRHTSKKFPSTLSFDLQADKSWNIKTAGGTTLLGC